MTVEPESITQWIYPESVDDFRANNDYMKARKSARTKARPVTAEDIRLGLVTPQSGRIPVPGHLITMETKDGEPEMIAIGDFIAEGKIGELHRITSDVMAKRVAVAVEPSDPRWSYYVDANIRQVVQLTEPTFVRNPRGDEFYAAPGDWLVDMSDDWWVVESTQFKDTHDLL